MEIDEGYDRMEMEEGCSTPKHGDCQIPANLFCPPAPKKKPLLGKKPDPPKNGYFHPPDLELLFTMAPRRDQACA